MAKHNLLGKTGENIACDFLTNNGVTIIERNYRFHQNEIDIIATDNEYIIFVEVKTRSNNQWGNPEEAVHKAKIKRLITAAEDYIFENLINLPVRFDIISIIINNNSNQQIHHIKDAFLPPINS